MNRKENLNIIIENTEYSLLIYFLLKKEWQKDTFVLSNMIRTEVLKMFQKIVKRIFIVRETSIKKNILKYYKSRLELYIFFKKLPSKKDIYGNDGLEYSEQKKRGYIILEDGLINYQKKRDKSVADRIKLLFKLRNPFYEEYGYSKNVKKIYLTGLAEIPKAIKDKVEIINLEELWSKKSEEEKKQINEIFGVNIESLQKIEDRKIILFTQPLSEDGIISEEEKIEIYSKILEKYQQKDIIIKSHPREKTNYSDYFPECYVMKEKYPVELMILNGLKVDRAITLFSTAVFSLNKMAKVDFYGTEVHPKLLERFGSMDHIIKRNCYL